MDKNSTKTRIYLVGADAKECRSIRGNNLGVLLSFFNCSPKRLTKVYKSLTGIPTKVKETNNDNNDGK